MQSPKMNIDASFKLKEINKFRRKCKRLQDSILFLMYIIVLNTKFIVFLVYKVQFETIHLKKILKLQNNKFFPINSIKKKLYMLLKISQKKVNLGSVFM